MNPTLNWNRRDTGRLMVLLSGVRIVAERISPSALVCTSTTLPNRQVPRGKSSLTRTMSPVEGERAAVVGCFIVYCWCSLRLKR